MLKYWFKILKTENCILKNCYEDMLESSVFKSNDKLNWGCKIRDVLCKHGFNHVWLSQNVVFEVLFLTFNTLFKKDKCNVSIFTPLWKPHTSHP
jgi:hypothetical protein